MTLRDYKNIFWHLLLETLQAKRIAQKIINNLFKSFNFLSTWLSLLISCNFTKILRN